jgi:Flp pilus assembly protein TadG
MKLRKRQAARCGTAVVELAICLPVMLVLVLGAIESCSMIFVDQSLNVVAYETIRSAIRANARSGEALTRAQQVIGERRLNQTVVSFDPPNPEAAARGTPVTVTVTAPTAANSVMRMDFFSGSLQAVVVMNKE